MFKEQSTNTSFGLVPIAVKKVQQLTIHILVHLLPTEDVSTSVQENVRIRP